MYITVGYLYSFAVGYVIGSLGLATSSHSFKHTHMHVYICAYMREMECMILYAGLSLSVKLIQIKTISTNLKVVTFTLG